MRTKVLYVSHQVTDVFDDTTGKNRHYQKGTFLDVENGTPYVNVNIDGDFPNFEPKGVYEADVAMKLVTKDSKNFLQVSSISNFSKSGHIEIVKDK